MKQLPNTSKHLLKISHLPIFRKKVYILSSNKLTCQMTHHHPIALKWLPIFLAYPTKLYLYLFSLPSFFCSTFNRRTAFKISFLFLHSSSIRVTRNKKHHYNSHTFILCLSYPWNYFLFLFYASTPGPLVLLRKQINYFLIKHRLVRSSTNLLNFSLLLLVFVSLIHYYKIVAEPLILLLIVIKKLKHYSSPYPTSLLIANHSYPYQNGFYSLPIKFFL